MDAESEKADEREIGRGTVRRRKIKSEIAS
jgi:hypothetical protein